MKTIIITSLATVILFVGPIFSQEILTLNESKQLALKNNMEAKNNLLEIEAAKQIKKAAFTNYFPQISASAFKYKMNESLYKMKMPGGNLPVYDGNPANLANVSQFAYLPASAFGVLGEGTIVSVNVTQPVFAGGRIVNGNKLASLAEQASLLKERLKKSEILIDVEEKYWQIVSLEEKKQTLHSYEKMLSKLENQAMEAYDAGLILKNDLLKVQIAHNRLLLNKSQLKKGTRLAKMAFCQFIGIPFDSSLVYEKSPAVKIMPHSFRVDHQKALKKRTEFELLQLGVESEELQTRMVFGEYLPQVAVGVSGLYAKLDKSESGPTTVVFGTASVPISDWWGGAHKLEERSIKEKISKNTFSNTSQLLVLQMEKTWQDFSNAFKAYQISKETLVQAKENLQLNEDSYKNGLINLSDLLEAQAGYKQAENQQTEAKTNYLIQKIRYLQVTGRNID